MSDIYNEFRNTFNYYADYYRFLELNDERVYNYIIEATKKKVSNPSINDLVNMTIKVYYKQAKVRFLQDNKYLLGLFKEHFIESDIDKSLENINLIIVKAKYELTFEACLLILNNYPSIKNYIEQNGVKNSYLLKKIGEIIEIEKEEVEEEKDLDIDTSFATTDNITAYINETRNIPMLSWEEQLELANKMVEGDKKAREELIKSNLRLVISIAKKQVDRGVEFLDLIEAGNEGLLKAVDRYNPKLGYKFTTYATWWIKQNIQRSIFNEGRTIRVPVHYAERIYQFTKELRRLELRLGKEPSFKEMLSYMDYSEDEIRSFLVHTGMVTSLNVRIGEEEDNNELQEFIPDETNVENQVLDKEFFDGAIGIMQKILDDRSLMVLILRTGLDGKEVKTLEEIGTSRNLTRERVRQIQKKASEKLYNNKMMKAYINGREVSKTFNPIKSSTTILFDKSGKDLQEIVSLLPSKDQELLKKRYGEDLVATVNYDMTVEELSYIYRVIVPRVKQIMSESRLEKIEVAFGDYAKEVEDMCLNANEKEIIKNHKLVANSIEEKVVEGIVNNLNGRSLYSLFKEDARMVDLVINLFFSEYYKVFDIFFNSKEVIKEEYLDKVVDRLIKVRKVLEKDITLDTIFPDIRRIFIDKAIDNLSNEDKEILKLAFGEDFNDNLKVVDGNNLKIVLNKIKVLASKRTGNINIISLFPEYSRDMIKEAIKKLFREEHKVLVYYFGINLDEGVDSYIYDKNLREILNIIYKLLNNEVITLKEYLGVDNITIEEYLTEEDRELLRLALGNNYYDNPVNNFLYPEEKVKFRKLIKKLQSLKGVTSIVNILGLTDNYYNAIYEVLLSLTEEEKNLLISYLGKNPFNINKEKVIILENSKIDNLLKKIKNKAIDLQVIVKGNESLAFYRYIGYNKVKILDGIEKLSKEEIEIISRVFGYNFLECSVLKEYNYENIAKLNMVKENLLTIISKLKTFKTRRIRGFYEYFDIDRKDRFYIKIVLDSLEPHKLEIIKKRYGDNFLDDDSYKSGLTNKEFDVLTLIKKTLKSKIEFLKKQEEENMNYFFDVFLKIDKDVYYDIVKDNIDDLDEYDKKLLVASFGKYYLDYPLEYKKQRERTKIMNIRGKILKGITAGTNFFYNFLGIPLEDKKYLEIIIKNLTPIQRLSLEKRFGDDFLNNPVLNKVDNTVCSETRNAKMRILSDIAKLKDSLAIKPQEEKNNTLFTYLELDYDKDRLLVEEAINNLPEKLKEIIILKFGEDYINNPLNNDINGKGRTLNRAKQMIRDYVFYKPKEFYECLGLTKEDIPYIEVAVKCLTPYRLEILKKKYGEDFLHKVERSKPLDKSESANIWSTKNYLIKKIEELKKRNIDNNYFNYLKNYLKAKDALILCLYLGFYERKYTIQELAILFEMNEKEMLLKLKEIVETLKQYETENINKLILNITVI